MIAVTGATGEVGRRVVARLDNPRLVVRDPARAPAGADVRVAAGYHAFDEMRAALGSGSSTSRSSTPRPTPRSRSPVTIGRPSSTSAPAACAGRFCE